MSTAPSSSPPAADPLAQHRATLSKLFAERLTPARLAAIVDAVIAKAEKGDLAALRLALNEGAKKQAAAPAPPAPPKPAKPAATRPTPPAGMAELMVELFMHPGRYRDLIPNQPPAVSDPANTSVVRPAAPPPGMKSPPAGKPSGQGNKSG